MRFHFARATTLAAVTLASTVTLLPAAANASSIENQIFYDVHDDITRTSPSGLTMGWAPSLNIGNCVAQVDIFWSMTRRRGTKHGSETGKFHLSQIRGMDRGTGSTFGQEYLTIWLNPGPDGKPPIREEDSEHGRSEGSGITIPFNSAAAADRTHANIQRLQQMCSK